MNFIKNSLKLSGVLTPAALLIACSGGSLPKPTPLSDYTQTASTQAIWRVSANDGNNGLHLKQQPVISNNIIYSAGNNGYISAINAESGDFLWKLEYPTLPFSSALAANNNAVFVGTNQAQVVKLDKNTGKLIWEQTVPSSVMAAPIANDNYVFVKTIDDGITTLNANNGKPVWNQQQPQPSLTLRDAGNPLLAGNNLYVGFATGAIVNFAPSNGTIKWNKQITAAQGKTDVERMVDIDATPIIENGTMYIAAYQTQITAVNLSTQAETWHYNVSNYNDLAIDNNNIYITDATGNVIALDKFTGMVQWKQEGLQYRYLTAPLSLDNNNLIAIGDAEGYLHLLNKKDGSFAGRVRVDSDGISATPMLASNGFVIVLSNDGDLYAYTINNKK